MGIPKLATFIQEHFTGWKNEELKGHLVIDGNNVKVHLNKCDWSHGGQFGKYRKMVLGFYKDLQDKGIVPLVVLDGIDHTGEKWRVINRRSKGRLRKVSKLIESSRAEGGVHEKSIFPTLYSEVYIQALQTLKVEYVVTDGEADDILVKIANYYGCPLLSSDSDFYLHNLKCGFVQLNRMDKSKDPVTADVYHYEIFCEQFQFKD